MGYTAVKGGLNAMLAAERLIQADAQGRLAPEAMARGARLLIDQVMSEGGLYAPDLAAMAVAQSEGDPIEAAFLLRAFRSTLPRLGATLPADGQRMRVHRRISSAFKDVPGGQLLGRTRDYTQRLLAFAVPDEPAAAADEAAATERASAAEAVDAATAPAFPSVAGYLRGEGLLPPDAAPLDEPFDLTRDALRFPAPRSARLQALARGETGFMVAIAYTALRGYGAAHPAIGDLRHGELPIQIRHPITQDAVTIGAVRLTEVEAINHTAGGLGGATIVRDEAGGVGGRFDLGYGAVFGQHERKAIAMAVLDMSMNIPGNVGPAADEEFVLQHCDAMESSGFVEHLKMPHYVTFQSALDRVRFQRLAALDRQRVKASV